MGRIIAVAALAGFAGAAFTGAAGAQEFKGAEIAVEALSFTESDDDIASTNYRGSVEVGVFGGFGVAADLTFYDVGDLDDDVRNITVHAVYDALAVASLGAFYTRESLDGADANTFGIEAGRSFGQAGAEGFLGRVDDDGADATLYGFEAGFDVTPSITLTASGAAVSYEDAGFGRVGVGGEYRFGGNGPALYAQVGKFGADAEGVDGDSSTFVGLGARLTLGPNRGTTFGQRGIAEVIAGF